MPILHVKTLQITNTPYNDIEDQEDTFHQTWDPNPEPTYDHSVDPPTSSSTDLHPNTFSS